MLLLPEQVGGGRSFTYVGALQLRTHHSWLQQYQLKHGGLPRDGGHRFVLSTWTSGVVPHTEQNLAMFFAPDARDDDPAYRECRARLARGENPWPNLEAVGSEHTHYAGRARQHLSDALELGEAWLADDNEGVWRNRDGTVNVLLADGNVRMIGYAAMRERHGLGRFDKDRPVLTYGAASPIELCRKLDR